MNLKIFTLFTAFIQLILIAHLGAVISKSDCNFVILITSYNNELWAEENLDSACWQESTNPYHVIYINDCSTDNTGNVVDAYVKKHHLEEKVTVIHNEKNRGAMANIYHAIHELIADDKIVVSLDGDDALPHSGVLLKLEKYYDDPLEVWITYGSYGTIPEGIYFNDFVEEVPAWVFETNQLRDYPFQTSHLRTFRAWLFKLIAKEDFFYDGRFMPVAWDMAMMFPMLEMSYSQNGNHIRCIQETMYNYRVNNPLSDFRIAGDLQDTIAHFIRNKKNYSPLEFNKFKTIFLLF